MQSGAKLMVTQGVNNPANWLGGLLSLLVGGALFWTTGQTIENDARMRFGYMARNVQATLNSRYNSYADVLRSAASLFVANNRVTRDMFRNYVAGLDLPRHFPDVATVNFAHHFTDAERDRFEAEMLHDIDGRGRDAPIMPGGRRGEYTVLSFVEPGAAWIHRVGFDMHSKRGGSRILDHSRDTREVSVSGAPIKEGSVVMGLAMRLPVYRTPMLTRDVARRRAAYLGSVGIGFSIDSLARAVLDSMPKNATRLVIFGVTPSDSLGPAAGASVRAAFFDNAPGETPGRGEVFHTVMPVGLSGLGWEIDLTVAKHGLYTNLDRALPWLALLVGTVGTALLYMLFETLSSSRRRAVSMAEDMTKELRASETKLRMTNENLRRLAARAENIKESERKRIAREIHDDLGQNLLVLRIEVDLLAARTARFQSLNARTPWMLEQIDAAVKSVRQIINDLRPDVLDLGLAAAGYVPLAGRRPDAARLGWRLARRACIALTPPLLAPAAHSHRARDHEAKERESINAWRGAGGARWPRCKRQAPSRQAAAGTIATSGWRWILDLFIRQEPAMTRLPSLSAAQELALMSMRSAADCQHEDQHNRAMAQQGHPCAPTYLRLRAFFDSLCHPSNSGARLFSFADHGERAEYWSPNLRLAPLPTGAFQRFKNPMLGSPQYERYIQAAATAGWPADCGPFLWPGNWYVRTRSDALRASLYALTDEGLCVKSIKFGDTTLLVNLSPSADAPRQLAHLLRTLRQHQRQWILPRRRSGAALDAGLAELAC